MITQPTPDGCRHCGVAQRPHFQRWTPEAGWHGWAAPADVQRLGRMLARRAHRRLLEDLRKHETPAGATAGVSTPNP